MDITKETVKTAAITGLIGIVLGGTPAAIQDYPNMTQEELDEFNSNIALMQTYQQEEKYIGSPEHQSETLIASISRNAQLIDDKTIEISAIIIPTLSFDEFAVEEDEIENPDLTEEEKAAKLAADILQEQEQNAEKAARDLVQKQYEDLENEIKLLNKNLNRWTNLLNN